MMQQISSSSLSVSPIPSGEAEPKTLWLGDVEPWMDDAYILSLFAHLPGEVVQVKVIRDKVRTNVVVLVVVLFIGACLASVCWCDSGGGGESARRRDRGRSGGRGEEDEELFRRPSCAALPPAAAIAPRAPRASRAGCLRDREPLANGPPSPPCRRV